MAATQFTTPLRLTVTDVQYSNFAQAQDFITIVYRVNDATGTVMQAGMQMQMPVNMTLAALRTALQNAVNNMNQQAKMAGSGGDGGTTPGGTPRDLVNQAFTATN